MAKNPAIPATNAPESAATWEPIDSLTPWGRNPRKNDDGSVARLMVTKAWAARGGKASTSVLIESLPHGTVA